MAEPPPPNLEPSLTDSTLKPFPANGSPSAGNTPSASPESQHADHSNDSRTSSASSTTASHTSKSGSPRKAEAQGGSGDGGLEQESGIAQSAAEGGDDLEYNRASSSSGPTVTVSVFHEFLCKRYNCHDPVALKETVDSAGEGRSKIEVTTSVTVHPKQSEFNEEAQKSEEWVKLHIRFVMKPSQQLNLSDYDIKACLKVSLYDQNAGCYLRKKVKVCHDIHNGIAQFFLPPLVQQCKVENRGELKIQVNGKITCTIPVTTSEYVYTVPTEETCDHEQYGEDYMNIDLNNNT